MFKKKRKYKPSYRHLKVAKNVVFSYKKPEELQRFTNFQGSIISREQTGLLKKQQRRLTREIKRARHLAMLTFTQTI